MDSALKRSLGFILLLAAVLMTVLNAVTAREPVWIYVLAIIAAIAGTGLRVEALLRTRTTRD